MFLVFIAHEFVPLYVMHSLTAPVVLLCLTLLSMTGEETMQVEPNPRRKIEDFRVIREQECLHLTGLSRVTRFNMERRGEFPQKVKLGARSTGWHAWRIRNWLENRASTA